MTLPVAVVLVLLVEAVAILAAYNLGHYVGCDEMLKLCCDKCRRKWGPASAAGRGTSEKSI